MIAPENISAAEAAGLTIIGDSTRDPYLYISHNSTTLVDCPIDQLKPLWRDGLVKHYCLLDRPRSKRFEASTALRQTCACSRNLLFYPT